MLDKSSGKVAYAVMSFGGFLGIGEDYYPMPWSSLKYDTQLGGYRIAVTEDQLKGAPRYNRNTDWDWSDRSRDRTVYDYYKQPCWLVFIFVDVKGDLLVRSNEMTQHAKRRSAARRIRSQPVASNRNAPVHRRGVSHCS